MWWYAALHANLLAALAAWPGARGRPLVDAGCGTGGFLRRLAERADARPRFGVEVMEPAAQLARARGRAPVAVGSVLALPVGASTAGAIVSADVLSHRLVDPPAALAEFHQALAPGGVLVLNLPAFRWLLSAHDRAVHNTRRFTRPEVARLLETAGFRVLSARYWNALLFPLMVVQRKLLARNAAASDVRPFPPAIEAAFRAVTALERALLRAGVRFPFGGSILAVAEKL